MINQMDLEKKTYEILLSEAQNLVRLYTKEWNDFHPSDPGVTILENLTAFEILQQSEINEMTVEIQKKLLELVGIVPNKNKAATVLVKAVSEDKSKILCKNQKLFVDDVCFETIDSTECGMGQLSHVLRKEDNHYVDISDMLDSNIPNEIAIWGEEVVAGKELVFVFESLPLKERKVYLQVHKKEEPYRNAFIEEDHSLFATVKWELQSESRKIPLEVKDETYEFLQAGTICITLPDEIHMTEIEGYSGYIIYATLESEQYENNPEIIGIDSGLFELKQQNTHAAVQKTAGQSGGEKYKVEHELLETEYLSVYVKEDINQIGYYKYQELSMYEEAEDGRYFRKQTLEYGAVNVDFINQKTGYGPDSIEEAILFLTLSEEMMLHRNLGQVYGYDNQKIDITPYIQIIESEFLILAELEVEKVDENTPIVIYEVFEVDTKKKNGIIYTYDDLNNELIIKDAGIWEGANIFIANCVTTEGKFGNILPSNLFESKSREKVCCTNPFIGTGGTSQEQIEEMKQRFVKDIKKIYALVTKEDYEEVIQQISGLCIERSYAYYRDQVTHIVAKPVYGGQLGQLTPIYRNKINRILSEQKLLSTEVKLEKIEYIPLVVNCSLYTSNHEAETRRQVEIEITKYIEELVKRGFGTPIIYSEIYQYIQRIACVDSVYELTIMPITTRQVVVQGADIYPNENGLCYLKEIKLVLHESDFIR